MRDVYIDHLNAAEGRAVAMDLAGDQSGRASFLPASRPYISADNVTVGGNITAGKGEPGFVSSINMKKQYTSFGAFDALEAANLQVCLNASLGGWLST